MDKLWTCFVFFMSLSVASILCEKDKFIYCGACICMTEEMGWQLSAISDKKKVKVGDFRIDSEGKINENTVQYKKSDVYLYDVLEKICHAMSDFHVTVDPRTKKRSFIRTSPRFPGERVSLTNIVKNNETSKMLKFACENIIEEYEDEILAMFKEDTQKEINDRLCVKMSGYCTEEDIRDHMMATGQAIMLGYHEATGREMDGLEGMLDFDAMKPDYDESQEEEKKDEL